MLESVINEVLADIDAEADAGICSNWSEWRESASGNCLIVTLADGTEQEYDRHGTFQDEITIDSR